MAKRRKKWKAPVLCDPTIPAKQVWKAIYGEPWPKGWKVKWVGFMRNAMGLCSYGCKLILLNYADAQDRPAKVLKGWVLVGADNRNPMAQLTPDGAAVKGAVVWPGRQGQVIKTLIHEFVHLRNKGLRHGAEFDRLVEWGWRKLLNDEGAQ